MEINKTEIKKKKKKENGLQASPVVYRTHSHSESIFIPWGECAFSRLAPMHPGHMNDRH